MTLEDFLETARGIGFDGVELTAYYFPSTERPYLNELKRRIHHLGLSISGTAIGTDFTQMDSEKRAAHVQMAKDWIERSVILGVPTMRVFAGPVREPATEQDCFGWCVEALQECAEYAEERGVLLALANEWLGINLDFGNIKGDAYSQFRRCADKTVATHAKATFEGRSGREAVDYSRVKSILESAKYRGWIAIEYEESEDAKTGVPRFARELFSAFRS